MLKNFFKRKSPLKTTGVRFSYGEDDVLKDVSIDLKKGEMIAVIGKSGSGKSTFLKLIAGIISKKYYGKIRIFGKRTLFKKHLIGFVPQENSFIPDLSIEDNFRIMGLNVGIKEKVAVKKGLELMKRLKVDESLNKLPTELSGGQKVRINIILSLLHEPKIIILDEPFVGLDFSNRRILWHFLGSLKKQGKSICLTSHLLTETQEHVDRLVILKKGKTFFTGKLERLKEKLKVKFILELKFPYLSKDTLAKIRKYILIKEIKVLDHYQKYLMFGLKSEKEKDNLLKFLEKLNQSFTEVSFREPNLDEIFMTA